jgi:hypothetical protein
MQLFLNNSSIIGVDFFKVIKVGSNFVDDFNFNYKVMIKYRGVFFGANCFILVTKSLRPIIDLLNINQDLIDHLCLCQWGSLL